MIRLYGYRWAILFFARPFDVYERHPEIIFEHMSLIDLKTHESITSLERSGAISVQTSAKLELSIPLSALKHAPFFLYLAYSQSCWPSKNMLSSEEQL